MFDQDPSTPTRSAWRSQPQRRPFRLLGAAASAVVAVAALTTAPATAAHTDGATDTVIGSSTRRTAHVEVMRLNCTAHDGDVAAIRCRWSVPDDAAGTRLLRVALGSGTGRVTVHRTDDPSANTYVDTPVRRGVRYLYAVRAIDAAGRLVGASRPAIAGVPVPDDPPAVEVLRLKCAATGADTVRCGWNAPIAPAGVLTLWRSVDGGVRERVASFRPPFATSYGDQVPAASSRAVYTVIATDGAGEIVARSRADGVTFSDVEPPAVDVGPTDRPPAETRPVETRPETRWPGGDAPGGVPARGVPARGDTAHRR